MSSISKLRKSRYRWSRKAIERGEQLRYQRKENARIKKERDKYKTQAHEAKKQLEKERKKSTPVQNKEELVYVSPMLFLVARISFRAVPKVLAVLANHL